MPYRTTPFPLIFAAVAACHWLVGSCAAQERQNQFFPYPVQPFAVTSPAVVDQTPQGEIVDHQSMSPDSWSAPTTTATTAPPTSQPAVDRSIIRWPASPATPNEVNNDFDLGELVPSGRQRGERNSLESQFLTARQGSGRLGPPLESTPSIPDLKPPATKPDPDSVFQPSSFARHSAGEEPNEFAIQHPSFPDRSEGLSGQDGQPPIEPTLSLHPPQAQASRPLSAENRYPLGEAVPVGSTHQHLASEAPLHSVLADGFGYGSAVVSQRPSQLSAAPIFGVLPNQSFRSSAPTVRHSGSVDHGQRFEFENKKQEYPPFREILATGRYFGSTSLLFLQPSFQTNTAITTLRPGFGESLPFDFDYETAPAVRFGFESKYGPGLELNYWQYDENSNVASFVSDGVATGEASTWMMGPYRWSRLVASNPGDRVEAIHSLDVETINAMFFKEIKFPISRLNGSFGLQYVNIAQALNATLSNGGSTLGRLRSTSDMRAYGPRFRFEYFRPIGHTPFEFQATFAGSVLFGERDQFVSNTATNDFSRVGADEFLTTTEFTSGILYRKRVAENRSWYARAGFIYQAWLGGGTAVDAQDDFGLRGFSFAVGYNR